MKYTKINSDDVFNYMKDHELTVDFYTVYHSSKMVAKYLNTSVYQARKCLKELVYLDKIKYGNTVFIEYGEYGKIENRSAPINGYTIK